MGALPGSGRSGRSSRRWTTPVGGQAPRTSRGRYGAWRPGGGYTEEAVRQAKGDKGFEGKQPAGAKPGLEALGEEEGQENS
jgi:hypothetical protein